jgi:acetamidase/formamidase
MDDIVALRKANPGGGPHSVTGPIYVNGAEPGDVMEIKIVRIVPKAFAINFNLPGKDFPTIGALAPEMPDGFVKFFTMDVKKRQAEFKPGITLDLRPFPGTLAVGIDPNDPSPARAAPPTRWRRSRRSGRGRTARTWTSTSCRKAPRSSSRSSSRAGWCGRATRTAARATARST